MGLPFSARLHQMVPAVQTLDTVSPDGRPGVLRGEKGAEMAHQRFGIDLHLKICAIKV